MKRFVSLLVSFLLLNASTLNWMAGGNFTVGDFAIIMGKAQNFDKSITDGTAFASAAQAISADLNSRWAEAWNVVIVQTDLNKDTVQYGYAYNQHWFWFNGILMNSGKYVGLIIWKDWHCVGWMTINSKASGFTQTSDTVSPYANNIIGASRGMDVSDIWTLATEFVPYLSGYFPAMGADPWIYTVIYSQDSNPDYFSRICAKNYYISNSQTMEGGSVLALQMQNH